MGSKISKAVRPHVNVAASSASMSNATSAHHEKLQMDKCQDRTLPHTREGGPLASDNSTGVAASSTPHDYSPSPTTHNDHMDIDQSRQNAGDLPPVSVPEALQELPGGFVELEPRPLPRWKANKPPPPPPKTCLICTTAFEKDEKPIKPCRCEHDYCVSCLRKMFLDACTDQTRMPPRCCIIIPIHHVRPHLSKEEANRFREKFEEWNTPKPFYCPVARCSAFIPSRLLTTRINSKGKQRVDSGIGTPTSLTAACPKCETEVCVTCRSLAHAGAPCEPLEFGIDKETAQLLKRWGYRECPKCGNGVKRMFGCNHMECRCGAHFCWGCMRSQEECRGNCDNEDEDYDSYSEPDDEEDEVQHAQEPDNTGILATTTDGTGPAEPGAQTAEGQPIEKSADTRTLPDPTPQRVRNLDGGSGSYWENQDMNFGEEPGEDYQDSMWDCDHGFNTPTIKLADSLQNPPSHSAMECMKCWATIHPEIEMPKNVERSKKSAITMVSAGARSVPGGSGGRATIRGRVRGRAIGGRGLWQPVDFARSVPDLNIMSQSPLPVESMEDVESTSQASKRVVDTYGNTIGSEKPHDHRRFSLDDTAKLGFQDTPFDKDGAARKTQRLSFNMDASPFSFAYSCSYCGLLVCSLCKDEMQAARKEKEEAEEKERQQQEESDRQRQEELEKREEQERTRQEAEQKEKQDAEQQSVNDTAMANPNPEALAATQIAKAYLLPNDNDDMGF
ncbi:hypothetical protein CC80DRAFT_442074 [Byssothecium circinans]|uniref:RBR-type E3 ubiquitin transferase n=1 Tax=Byssothecium circinans TaxID=147558 RepID=A0A6A5UAX1_9PLEO|nr:hypothetical protein CC80DRAFT_442074 [Byssothecium circinans]